MTVPLSMRRLTAAWAADAGQAAEALEICVFIYVGENDEDRWHDELKRDAEFLQSKGDVARYMVEKGQPHRLETLAGDHASRLFEGGPQGVQLVIAAVTNS